MRPKQLIEQAGFESTELGVVGFQAGKGALLENQARAAGAGFPAGTITELVEALDGEDQALAETGSRRGRAARAGCQASSQAAQQDFLLGWGQNSISFVQKSEKEMAQAKIGSPFRKAVTPSWPTAPGLTARLDLNSGPDDQILGSQVGKVMADIGGGNLEGRGQLGGAGAVMGGKVIQDALAGGFYKPIPP
jgi:hypothetical protein